MTIKPKKTTFIAALATIAIASLATTPALAQDWAGPFAGGGIGYTTNSESPNDANIPFEGVEGFYAGVQGGWNFQSGSFVYGPEAELNFAFQESDTAVGAPFNTNVNTRVRWKGLVGGRVGLAQGDFMPYAKAGFAFGNSEVTITANGAKDDQTQTGYYAGGGIEFRMSERVSLRGEAIYVNLEEKTFFDGLAVGYEGTDLRASVNYKF